MVRVAHMNTNRVSDKWNLNLGSFASRLISSEAFLNKLNEHLQGQHKGTIKEARILSSEAFFYLIQE